MQRAAVRKRLPAEMLTIADVALLLRMHPNSVRRWANSGLLRCYRIGVRGDRWFRATDVREFVEAGAESNGEGR